MSWIDNVWSLMDLGRVGLVVGLVATVVTYLMARRRTTRVGYVHQGEHLLGSASDALPSGIVVQYDGLSIPRLTKSVLIIWNSGESTVLGSDIVDKDPLRFCVGADGQILSISVLKVGRQVNDFAFTSPRKEMSEAEFTFNFLDADDGVVVEILHTSTDRQPRIKGTLRGLPQGFRNFGQFTRPKPQKKKRSRPLSAFTAVVFSPLVFFCASLVYAFYGPRPEVISADAFNGLMGGLGGVSGMLLVNAWATRRKYPKSLHLESLE
ncbi:hypothetical protein [Pseudomonas sp. BRG-100]|uniref:hypothetical protein n=1 Tax=Pseudomonas sp. BRG-100 TaxID=1524267 RepID=UPI0013E09FAE|nr:hypothetical protein [Pseudomonas sp. BRG-100]